jgi:hypothetical protein
MPAALEMAVGFLGLGERESPVDHGAQAMREMARFIASKSARLPTLIEPSVMPRPVSNKGSSPVPDRDRAAPIRLICSPTAKAFSDVAMVPGRRFRQRSPHRGHQSVRTELGWTATAAFEDHQIAVIERARAHPHQNLPQSGPRVLARAQPRFRRRCRSGRCERLPPVPPSDCSR